ncbi:MAG TPA: hypothetical protein VKD65_04880, partial [Candidatus Angelobacter sp.]|nr:hypothetical protein [Candidatus Angelobacter sp.]
MSLICTLRNSRALSLFAICLLALPSLAQNGQQTSQSGSTQQQTATVQQTTTQSLEPQPAVPESRKLPPPTGIDYSKPARPFPNVIAPYKPRPVSPPSFANTPKIEELLQNGKIMLSLNDAIA